jgi:hypothetical protein
MRHGARSRQAVQKRASELRGELAALLGEHLELVRPVDMPLIEVAVDVLTKRRLITEYLDRTSGGSVIDLRGRDRPCAASYYALTRLAMSLFDKLGIGPASRSQLLGTAAASNSLAHQLARRRQELGLDAHPQATHNGGPA